MDKPTISIIVPIYNMAQYLRQCLDSIQSQTLQDWECILVDDGSSDNSPAICDEYVAKDARFKVIHKENGGVSTARNAGIMAATAEYIGFVDPDDWTEPNLFETLYDLIREYDADIAQVGFWRDYTKRHTVKHLCKERMVIDGKTAMRALAFDRIPNYLWNRLHKREIMTCGFPVGRSFEDMYVYGQWLKNVKKMVLDPTPLYHYRMRHGSIVHDSKNRYDFFHSCKDRMNMLREVDNGKKDIKKENAFVNKCAVNACKGIAREEKDKEIRDKAIARIRMETLDYPLPSAKYIGLKLWWRANLLRSKPKFFTWLMRAVYSLDFDSKRRVRQFYD